MSKRILTILYTIAFTAFTIWLGYDFYTGYHDVESWELLQTIFISFHFLTVILNPFSIAAFCFYIARSRTNPMLWKTLAIINAVLFLGYLVFLNYLFLSELDSLDYVNDFLAFLEHCGKTDRKVV